MSDRYIADIDVLIENSSWENAVNIALSQGWHSECGLAQDVAIHRMRQTHHSLDLQRGTQGLVDLHQFSLLLNRQLGADVMLLETCRSGDAGGIPVLLPHPSDQLAITLGHLFHICESENLRLGRGCAGDYFNSSL